MKKILFGLIITLMISFGIVKIARAQTLTDWVINDFKSEIVVNKDSSLDITEKITADCGNLSGKHGIYRVVPFQSYGEDGKAYKTPITLMSITDFEGKAYKYTQSINRSNHTISWKIGDPDITVSGINQYLIKYHVENAIRFGNADFDELYWNLNGNFWELIIQNYSARIIFPDNLNGKILETNLYSGKFGSNDKSIANYVWNGSELDVTSLRELSPGEGITISVTVPKAYFDPYVPTFWESWGWMFFILIPIATLVLCFLIWRRYGKDPNINPTIAPEFEIPEKLTPIQFGMIKTDGGMKNNFLTAGIINLAVKRKIKIEQISKGSILSPADYKLVRTDENDQKIQNEEKSLMSGLFSGDIEVTISSLKNKFYKEIPNVTSAANSYLEKKGWLEKSSRSWLAGFIAVGIIVVVVSFMLFAVNSVLAVSVLISGLIILIFSPLMRRRSEPGAILLRRVKGFELYMKKAEKYRQQWLEKQNIFEEFLPYAVVFGIAGEWVKKLKDIYGEEFFNSYTPIWYYGYAGSFNINNFSNDINSMSSNISSTLSSSPSSSGSGGGGFSGGGGGGGGGGGW